MLPVGSFCLCAILPISLLDFILDCNFDQGACEWVQDKSDDMDWSVAYHDNGNTRVTTQEDIFFIALRFVISLLYVPQTLSGAEYYMAVSGLLGQQEDVAKLKLLLSDRTQQGSFCLTFDYRVVGHHVGALRVLLDNNIYPVWEQSHSRAQRWQTEFLTVAWKEKAPQSVSCLLICINRRLYNPVNDTTYSVFIL